MPTISKLLNSLPDLIFGSTVVVGTVLLLIDAVDLPSRSALFPVSVLWCMLAVGAWTLLASALRALRNHGTVENPAAGWRDAIGVPTLIIAAAGAILYAFGFYVVSPLLIFAVYLWHTHASVGGALSRRSMATGATLAVVATGAMYLIFDILIGLPAPSGSLL